MTHAVALGARRTDPQVSAPRRASAALVIATLVTMAAALPLGLVAWSARSDGPASADGLMIELPDGVQALSGLVLQTGLEGTLQVDDPGLVAVAWALYDANAGLIASDEATGAAPFVLQLADTTLASLGSGTYDLLVTGTESDGDVVERAARFAVGDAQ